MLLGRNRHYLFESEKKRTLISLGLLLLALSWFVHTETLAIAGEFNITDNLYEDWEPAASGDEAIWVTCSGSWPDCDVYLYDFSTGIETKISGGGRVSTGPFGGIAISGNRIVWTDNRNTSDANDIWMFELPTGPETRLTSHNSEQYHPDISDDYIVYESSAGTTAKWGIYLYVISTSQEIEIAVDPSPGHSPAISGKRIVWVQAGDIYMYDFSTTAPDTGAKTQITSDSATQSNPDISEKRIVWEDDTHSDKEIYLYDFSTSVPVTTRITTSTADQIDPVISGDYIVWMNTGDYNIYRYDLSNQGIGEIQISTSGKAERPAVSGNRIVWEDGFTNERDIVLYDPATDPPSAKMTTPLDKGTSVPVSTNIAIDVIDKISGVDQSTIVMEVEGTVVSPTVTGGPLEYKLTYNPSNFAYQQQVGITIQASDLSGNSMSASFSFTTESFSGNPFACTNDDDCDDIPNSEEAILGSDPNKKTLFVRAREFALGNVYWTDEFMALFPPPSPPANGRAYIDAFAEAGIEVMVIGASDHPYSKIKNNPGYDPTTDDIDPITSGTQPPHINIMEVWKYNTFNAGSTAQGHTAFHVNFILPDGTTASQWRWDTKGLTPKPAGADPAIYLNPRVYIDPLDDYFTEGAYTSMAAGATTPVTTCTDAACDMVTINPTHLSPMNLNDTNHTLPPAPTSSDYGTVEANNDIFFCAGTESHDVYGDGSLIYNCTAAGEIYHVAAAPRGDGYVYSDVLRRTLIHEMGHGLHFDHCTNPYCIMWMFVGNWELYNGSSQTRYGFGTTGPAGESCTHATGIRADGTIHNSISP